MLSVTSQTSPLPKIHSESVCRHFVHVSACDIYSLVLAFTVISAPLSALLALLFLYNILGWASLAGLAVMVVLFPIPTKLGALVGSYQAKRMAAVSSFLMLFW
jgi:hypothetical protein